MATARQCKKVIGLDWDNLEYSVADYAATGEKWRGRHKCCHTLPQTHVEQPRRRFICIRNVHEDNTETDSTNITDLSQGVIHDT